MTQTGKLYLLPVPICEEDPMRYIPAYNVQITHSVKVFIAENAKTARRFLKLFSYPAIEDAEVLLLNEHTDRQQVEALLKPLLNGKDVALMSDAGCPGIADPGADVVRLAHLKGIEVVPLAGPSSIILSIMASGFNGQNFAFVGYLPIDKEPRKKRVKELELLAVKSRQAQFFIETPYRNAHLFDTLLSVLNPGSSLFLGINIGSPAQVVSARPVSAWKKANRPALDKVPVVFGIFTG